MSPWPLHRAPARAALLLLLALSPAGCGRRGAERTAPAPAPAPMDTVAADTTAADTIAADTALPYGTFVLANEDSLRALRRRLGAAGFDLVLRVNRLDLAHARQGDTLVVPPVLDGARLAPFPDTLGFAGLPPRLLLVSARVQAFAAYEAGRLARWGPTSTGRRESPTPAGLYHANWRQRTRRSTVDNGWILDWYVNLSNFTGISLHRYELPGRPASHSCVRLLEPDAEWLYRWVETWTLVPGDARRIARRGTPVVVLDAYDFDRPAPWERLAADPRATDVAPDSIAAALRRTGVLPPGTAAPPVTADAPGDGTR